MDSATNAAEHSITPNPGGAIAATQEVQRTTGYIHTTARCWLTAGNGAHESADRATTGQA